MIPSPTLREEKDILRREYLQQRKNIPEAESRKASDAICRTLTSLSSFRFSEIILFYSAVKGEIDLSGAAEKAITLGKKIAYPLCDTQNNTMTFRLISSPDDLIPGAYGIPEPSSEMPAVNPACGARILCLIPALIFDRSGYRIGYGKGYYDRFLADFRGTVIGTAMSGFVIPQVPHGKHDRKVDIIITEKGVITPK